MIKSKVICFATKIFMSEWYIDKQWSHLHKDKRTLNTLRHELLNVKEKVFFKNNVKCICFRDEEANAEEGMKRKKRKAIRYQSKRWTSKVIPYRVTSGFSKLSIYDIS